MSKIFGKALEAGLAIGSVGGLAFLESKRMQNSLTTQSNRFFSIRHIPIAGSNGCAKIEFSLPCRPPSSPK